MNQRHDQPPVQWLMTALKSIGDAVIATDAQGRVRFMNQVAADLTGWGPDAAAGRPLADIFRIVNEQTRQPAANPVEKVLETGHVVGLANHSVLIARDGTERPIDDSAAPIKDGRGEVTGVVLVFHDVTERRAAEIALRESESLKAAILESALDCIVTIDHEGKVLEFNPMAEKTFGYDRSEVIGRDMAGLIVPPELRERHHRGMARHLATGEATVLGRRVEVPAMRSDGTTFPIELAIVRIAAEPPTFSAYIRDLTERKLSERAAAEAERKSTDILESITDAFIALDARWRFTYANPEAERINGMTRDEMIGRDHWELFPAAVGTTIDREFRRAVAEQVSVEFENYYRPWDRWFAIRAYPTRDGGLSVYFQDVTERKRAEERFRFLAESMPQKIFTATTGGDVDYFNGQWMEFTGLAFEQIKDWGWTQFIHPDDVEENVRRWRHSIDTGEPFQLEHRFRRADGVYRWHLSRAHAMRDAAGKVLMWTGSNTDIDDVKRAQEAEHRRTGQLQRIAEISTRINAANDFSSVLGVVTAEARGLIGAHRAVTSLATPAGPVLNTVSLSDKYARWQGLEERFDGEGIAALACRANRAVRLTQAELERLPEWERYLESEPRRVPLRGWLAAPLVGRDGKNLGLIHLSDRHEGEFTEDDESILVQLAQMASVAVENARLYHELRENDRKKDEFLAMLAHELRNPLAAVNNAVTVLKLSAAGENRDWASDVVERQVKQLARLIDDLLDVSRITSGKIRLRKETVEVAPVLNSAVEAVRPLIEERRHELSVSFESTGLRAEADPTRLEQVAVNLLTNAAKYTESGGRITLSARRDGGDVLITVRDNGIGIPPEKLPQMFELFAQGERSIARSEGGLGIGLTIVQKLTEMHGGSVAASSGGPGQGSEFAVRIPAAKDHARPEREVTDGPAVAKKGARILVVDDNVDTARGMARLLKLLGHEVRIAHDGPRAIDVAVGFRPDFVLLDIGLPGMDGYHVAARLRRDEGLKDTLIIAVSGYGQDDDRRRSREAGFHHHLVKPVDHDHLMKLLAGSGTMPGD